MFQWHFWLAGNSGSLSLQIHIPHMRQRRQLDISAHSGISLWDSELREPGVEQTASLQPPTFHPSFSHIQSSRAEDGHLFSRVRKCQKLMEICLLTVVCVTPVRGRPVCLSTQPGNLKGLLQFIGPHVHLNGCHIHMKGRDWRNGGSILLSPLKL